MEDQEGWERIPHTSWKEISLVWCGVLVLLVVVNVLARWWLDSSSINGGYQVVKEKWQLLQSEKAPVDWLVLGDSACLQGVSPRRLSAKLVGTVLNLCTVADVLAVNDAWMLDNYIHQVGPPKHVIIVHTYHVWPRNISEDYLAHIPLAWGFWSMYEPHLELSTAEKLRVFLCRYLPTYFENSSLGFMIRKPWAIRQSQLTLADGGQMVIESANTGRVEKDVKIRFRDMQEKKPYLSAANRQALDVICRLAQRYNIHVYLVQAPIFEGLYENESARAYIDKLEQEVKMAAERTALVHHVFTKPPMFPAEAMADTVDHLTVPAAQDYTDSLADEIKK